MRIVLDTNVLVSGLLNPRGNPGRIVDLVNTGHLTVLFDDRILAEYRAVLARPRLKIDPTDAALALDQISAGGQLTIAPPLDIDLPDPKDVPFAEVAEAGSADALITGNGRDFVPSRGRIAVPVLTPAEFYERWRLSRRHPSFD